MSTQDEKVEKGLKMAEEAETGSRILRGKTRLFIRWFAIVMSIFHLYTGFFGELPGYQQLSVHLSFAMVLCFLCFPFSKTSPRSRLSIPDIILAIIGGAAAIYSFANYEHWINAQGDAAWYDIWTGGLPVSYTHLTLPTTPYV